MDLVWRELTVTDATAMAALTVAEKTADGVGFVRTEAQMAELFDPAGFEGPRYFYGAFDSDASDACRSDAGRMAAFGVLGADSAANPIHRMHLRAAVRPDLRRRGIGTELVRRALEAAPGMHARTDFPDAPLELMMLLLDQAPGRPEMARALGFEVWRRNYRMVRDLPPGPAELHAPVDAGLELVAFDPAFAEALMETHNTAFVPDHPGATPATPETWARRFTSPTFRTDLSFFIRDQASKTIAGYLLGNCVIAPDDSSRKRSAHLTTIATRREFRRRGVASALIGAALTAAVRQGFDTASLNVDSENPTGAVRVYERAGFRVRLTASTYTRKIGA